MEIESIQGKGLRVSMDYYLRLRRDTDGADFWNPECQDYLTEKLAPFLPRMAYDPIDNTVTASLFQSTRGQEQEEMLHKSKPIDNSSNVPEKAYNELKKKIDKLLREIDAEGIDPGKKRMMEAFALPDPQKSPELYRVYGKGKLAVLWGLEKNPGESILLREMVRRDDRHASGQWKKWLCVLLFVVVLGVGAFLYHCIACGGKGGDGTPDTHEGDSRGSGDTPAPREGKSEPSESTVSGPVHPRATQGAPAEPSNEDKKNAGKDGGDTQPPPAVSTSVPQPEEGTAETQSSSGGEDKKPAVDTGSGAPNVPVPEEVTAPQPGGGDGTATGTEGNSGTTTDGTAEQGVRVASQGIPAEPSNGDKENTGKDGKGTQSPTVDSTSAPQTEEGTAETPDVRGSEGKTPAIDTVPDTPTVPVPEEGTSPQPEGGDGTATETDGNSGTTTDGTAEQGVRVDPMQKDIQVEFPGRVIDFRFDVLPRKDVAPGNVRVSVRVSVIEGADNAIESGKINGVPLDANHCVEVQIKERGEELPYEIKLRNSKYPVTGGCKIKIETTK